MEAWDHASPNGALIINEILNKIKILFNVVGVERKGSEISLSKPLSRPLSQVTKTP